jgi:hypothetical protein
MLANTWGTHFSLVKQLKLSVSTLNTIVKNYHVIEENANQCGRYIIILFFLSSNTLPILCKKLSWCLTNDFNLNHNTAHFQFLGIPQFTSFFYQSPEKCKYRVPLQCSSVGHHVYLCRLSEWDIMLVLIYHFFGILHTLA